MCGRFSQSIDIRDIEARYGVKRPPRQLTFSLDIAPRTEVLSVRENETMRFLEPMIWGFSSKSGKPVFNVRAESLAKGSFRSLLLNQRCLIPADGFYEWRGEKGHKTKVRYEVGQHELFSFPAIFSDEPTTPFKVFTIFTTEPNELVAKTHHRMPVVLKPEDEKAWLDPSNNNGAQLLKMLAPYPAGRMTAQDYPGSPDRKQIKLL